MTCSFGQQQEPYDAARMGIALSSSNGKYQCGGNALWVDVVTSLTPNVPLVDDSIRKACGSRVCRVQVIMVFRTIARTITRRRIIARVPIEEEHEY